MTLSHLLPCPQTSYHSSSPLKTFLLTHWENRSNQKTISSLLTTTSSNSLASEPGPTAPTKGQAIHFGSASCPLPLPRVWALAIIPFFLPTIYSSLSTGSFPLATSMPVIHLFKDKNKNKKDLLTLLSPLVTTTPCLSSSSPQNLFLIIFNNYL